MSTRQPLILVPGLVCDGAVWAHQRAGLADVADCIVPDVSRPHTMQAMATEVLAAAPEKFAIAGFSMGGYVALEVLRQAPHRVTRLALIDTGARADSPEQTVNRKAAIADCQAGRYAAAIENMLPLLLHPTRLTEPLADQVRAMAGRVGSDCFVRRLCALMSRIDARDLLKAAKIPVRIICGRDDRLTPLARSQEIAELAPNARLSIVEDCGHMPLLERPHAATALMRDWMVYG
ncbi:MAG: alpha/beta fold hydrolase [Burkholderiales bacterium]